MYRVNLGGLWDSQHLGCMKEEPSEPIFSVFASEKHLEEMGSQRVTFCQHCQDPTIARFSSLEMTETVELREIHVPGC